MMISIKHQKHMKKISMILAVAALLTASCTKNGVEPAPGTDVINTLFGELEDVGDKVSIDSDGAPSWTVGDQFVLIKTGASGSSSETFICENPATGLFTNPESKMTINSGCTYTAFYPAAQYDGGSYVWPSSVEAPEVAGVYDASYVPMRAEVSIKDDKLEKLHFSNLAGLIRFNLKTYDASCRMIIENITVSADQGMSGEYAITGGKAVVSGTGSINVHYNKSFPAAGATGIDVVNDENRILYVGAPANDYTHLQITFSGKVNNNNTGWVAYSRTYTANKTMSIVQGAYTKMSFQKLGETVVTSLELSETDITLDTGSNFRKVLTAMVSPADAPEIVWTSSNKAVASVLDGTVYANAAGTAVITASCGGKKAYCNVTVTAPDPFKVYALIDGDDYSLEDDDPFEFYNSEVQGTSIAFRAKDNAGGVKKATWTITPTTNVTTKTDSRGKFTVTFADVDLVGSGYTVSATFDGVTKSYNITVVED